MIVGVHAIHRYTERVLGENKSPPSYKKIEKKILNHLIYDRTGCKTIITNGKKLVEVKINGKIFIFVICQKRYKVVTIYEKDN